MSEEIAERYLRQSEFIKAPEQEMLGKARVLVAGCGAGSPVAPNLARMGIGTLGEIILADPDRVEVGNLSRQYFEEEDLGKNKADALAKRLKKVNGDVRTRSIPDGITLGNVADAVGGADVVVEMVDVARPDITLAIHEQARSQGKPLVTGMDLGEGIITYVFDYRNPDQMSLRQFLGIGDSITQADLDNLPALAVVAQYILGPVNQSLNDPNELNNYYTNLLTNNAEQVFARLPEEMRSPAQKLIQGEIDYIPQINSAAALLGVTQSVIVKELVLGHNVKAAPDSVRINLLEQVRA